MRDTTPEIEEKMAELYNKLSPQKRLEMAFSMMATGRALMWAAIERENPGISKAKKRELFFRRMYGDCFSKEETERILHRLNPPE